MARLKLLNCSVNLKWNSNGLPIGFAMARLKRIYRSSYWHKGHGLPIGFAMARLKRVARGVADEGDRNGLPIGFAMARLKLLLLLLLP